MSSIPQSSVSTDRVVAILSLNLNKENAGLELDAPSIFPSTVHVPLMHDTVVVVGGIRVLNAAQTRIKTQARWR